MSSFRPRLRAVLPELFWRDVTLWYLTHPQKPCELFRVDTVVFLLPVCEPIRFQRIGERHVKVLIESVVDREVVPGRFKRALLGVGGSFFRIGCGFGRYGSWPWDPTSGEESTSI